MPLNIPVGYASVGIIHRAMTVTGSSPTFTFGVGEDDPAVILPIIQDWIDNSYTLWLSNEWQVSGVSVTTSAGTYVNPHTHLGQSNLIYNPPNVAVVVRKYTSSLGRANRGRMFWPGYSPESSVDEHGEIDPVWLDNIQQVADDLKAACDGGLGSMQLLHSSLSGPTTIANVVAETTVATVRRRLRG